MKTIEEIRTIIQNEYDKQTTDTNYNFISRFAKAIFESQSRPLEREKIIDAMTRIFENTERIHGKSEALDWIKMAIHHSAEYLSSPSPVERKEEKHLTDEAIAIDIIARFLLNPHPNQQKNYDREKIAFANGAKFAREFYENNQSPQSDERTNDKNEK